MIKFPNSGNKKELMLWVSETYRNVSMEVALNFLCYFYILVENDAGTAENEWCMALRSTQKRRTTSSWTMSTLRMISPATKNTTTLTATARRTGPTPKAKVSKVITGHGLEQVPSV